MSVNYDDVLSTLHTGCTDEQLSDDDRQLLEPYNYLTQTSGKGIRKQMIAAFNFWLNVPPDKLEVIARIVSMLHNASLLVDDVQDGSQLRRGNPVAHKIYGVAQTISSANYVYFLAFKELSALRAGTDPDVDAIFTDEMLNLHRGQGLEIFWRDTLQCPTEAQYLRMVNGKTGGLFRLAVKLLMAHATTRRNVDFIPLVNLIGVLYQIRDDYLNLRSNVYENNKGFAEDLTEGKFSFPIVHAIRADPSNRQILNILQKRPETPTLKRHAVAYMQNSTKSFDYTLNVLRKVESQVRAEIQRLGGNEALDAIVTSLGVKEVL